MKNLYDEIKVQFKSGRTILFYPNANFAKMDVLNFSFDVFIISFPEHRTKTLREQFNFAFVHNNKGVEFIKGSDRCRIYEKKTEHGIKTIFCIFDEAKNVLEKIIRKKIKLNCFIAIGNDNKSHETERFTNNEWLYKVFNIFNVSGYFVYQNTLLSEHLDSRLYDEEKKFYRSITSLNEIEKNLRNFDEYRVTLPANDLYRHFTRPDLSVSAFKDMSEFYFHNQVNLEFVKKFKIIYVEQNKSNQKFQFKSAKEFKNTQGVSIIEYQNIAKHDLWIEKE